MNVIQEIVVQRMRDVRAESREVPVETLQAMIDERQERRSLSAALRREAPAIVAEIKRASPSAGALDVTGSAAHRARAYERGGAAALSVVVEPHWFAGRFADLSAVRASTSLPVLCKDFVVADFQVYKAAAFGADAVLLIAAMLDDARLHRFVACAGALALETVIEVHSDQELRRALALGAHIIGINNRDLTTLTVDKNVAPRLAGLIPKDRTALAESGYDSALDLAQAMVNGLQAFLVGEVLMRDVDPAQALRTMREVHAWSG